MEVHKYKFEYFAVDTENAILVKSYKKNNFTQVFSQFLIRLDYVIYYNAW